MGKSSGIDVGKVRVSADLLRALAHPLRLQILSYIDKYKNVSVKQIYKDLDLAQSITSQHLQILRRAGLVSTRRQGKFIKYSVAYDKVNDAVEAIQKYISKEASSPD